MPIDQQIVDRISTENERAAAVVFAELGFAVEKLPPAPPEAHKQMPDFLVSDATGPVCLVEVKSILSAGYHPSEDAHHSLLDSRLRQGYPVGKQYWSIPVRREKGEGLLSKAAGQYRDAVTFTPSWNGLPFVVAFYWDMVATAAEVARESLVGFPEISSVVTEAQDWEFCDALWAEPIERQEWRRRTRNWDGLPRRRRRWAILTNPNAKHRTPHSIISKCLASNPDALYAG